MWKRKVACERGRTLTMDDPSNHTVLYPGRSPIISARFDPVLQWMVIYPSDFLIFFSSFWLNKTLTVYWLSRISHVLMNRICPWCNLNLSPLIISSYMAPPILPFISPSCFAYSSIVAFFSASCSCFGFGRQAHSGKSFPMCPVSPHSYQVRIIYSRSGWFPSACVHFFLPRSRSADPLSVIRRFSCPPGNWWGS